MNLTGRLRKLEQGAAAPCSACARRCFEVQSFPGETQLVKCALCGSVRPRLVFNPITGGAWPSDFATLRAEIEALLVRGKEGGVWRRYLEIYRAEFKALFYTHRGRTAPA